MGRATEAQRRRAAGRTCAYCGLERLDGNQRPEHPIPLVLGSRLTVFTVCDECNRRAGKDVDTPWLKHLFVQEKRAKSGVTDSRHKSRPIREPFLNGVFLDEDGHRVVVEDGVPRYPGSIVHGDDGISIAAETPERAAELFERLERQLAREGKKITDYSQKRQTEHRPWLKRKYAMSMSSGVRMGAKLGLAFAAEAFDEEWRTTAEAEQLRTWLWSDKPTNSQGNALAWVPSTEDEHPFAEPPTHVAHFLPLEDATALLVLVFGTLGFTVPVAPAGIARPTMAWCLEPGSVPVVTTFEELLMKAARRYA